MDLSLEAEYVCKKLSWELSPSSFVKPLLFRRRSALIRLLFTYKLRGAIRIMAPANPAANGGAAGVSTAHWGPT